MMTTIGDYDDRRISLYDNLSIDPGTTTTITTAIIESKELDITSAPSHVDYNNSAQKQSIFNGNQIGNIVAEQQATQQEQIIKDIELKRVQPQQFSYCDIGVFGSTTPITNTLLASSKAVRITTTTTTPLLTTTTTSNMQANSATTFNESSNSNCNSINKVLTTPIQHEKTQAYVSQYSPTEAYETSQNSIAAVKAALHDAKSKFFGVNDYSQEQENEHNRQQSIPKNSNLNANNYKKQPTYQNIPENSAIYRQNVTNATTTDPTIKTQSTPASEIEISPIYNTYNSSPTNKENNLKMSRILSDQPSTSAAVYTQIALDTALDQSDQPSQAVYMTTTVPQNIKGSKIAGRHTPTRNSLRHSRMLVVNNRNFQGVEYANPLNFKQPFFARLMLILNIVIGILISLLSLWIFLLAPSSYIQDNPYWSGLMLILSGLFGLWLIRFQRIKRSKFRECVFQFLRVFTFTLILLSLIFCGIAFFFAGLHYTRLTASDTRCVSKDILVELGSCVCMFNTLPSTNLTEISLNNGPLDEWKVEYRDLSCREVTGVFTFLLIISAVFNAAGLFTNLTYLTLLIFYRNNSKRFYTAVQTSTF